MNDEILFDIRDGIGHIVLNRPHARNALTFGMYRRLADICTDPGDAKTLILTGAGDKPFHRQVGGQRLHDVGDEGVGLTEEAHE